MNKGKERGRVGREGKGWWSMIGVDTCTCRVVQWEREVR